MQLQSFSASPQSIEFGRIPNRTPLVARPEQDQVALSFERAVAIQYWQKVEQRITKLSQLIHSVKEHFTSAPVNCERNRLPFAKILADLSIGESGRGLLDQLVPVLRDVHPELLTEIEFSAFPAVNEPRFHPEKVSSALPDFLRDIDRMTVSSFLYWFAGRLRSDSLEPSNELRERIVERLRPDRLKLLTYNVAGLPWFAGGKLPQRYREIGLHLNASDFDVVAIQEMWSSRTAELIQASQFPYLARTANMHGVVGGNGLLILSRHPVLSCELFEFSQRRSIERSVRKGAIIARIQRGDDVFDLINVHAPSSSVFNQESKIGAIRRGNLEELSGFLRARKTPGVPQFVIGDLNTVDAGADYENLKRLFGSDLYRYCHPSPDVRYEVGEENGESVFSGKTFEPGENPLARSLSGQAERLDYQFVDEPLGGRWAVSAERAFVTERFRGKPLSDHWGVSTEILSL